MGEIERQLKRAQDAADAAACQRWVTGAPSAKSDEDTIMDVLAVAQQFTDAHRHIDEALGQLDGDGQWEDSIRSAFESAGHAAAALEDARARLDALALGKLLVDGAEQAGGG